MTLPPDLNLGPLTTIFTPPPDCYSITVSKGTATSGSSSSYVPFVFPRLFSSVATSCFPSAYPLGNEAFTSTFGLYLNHDEHVYFSPGICPSGWIKNTVGSVNNGETTAFCCASGFNPRTLSAVIDGSSISTLCSSEISVQTVVTTVAYTDDGGSVSFSSSFTFSGDAIPAPAIWIRYKEADFPTTAATSTATTSTVIQSSTSQVSSSSTATATSSSTPSSESGGLSTGAKIGLGVGVPLVVILVAALVAAIFIEKRKRKHIDERSDYEGVVIPKSELPAEEIDANKFNGNRSTIGTVSELGVGAQESPRHELPGS